MFGTLASEVGLMYEPIRFRYQNKILEIRSVLAVQENDPLVIQLHAKLEEYRQRLHAPHMSAQRITRTRFKIWVLHELLARKTLSFDEMKAALLIHNNED